MWPYRASRSAAGCTYMGNCGGPTFSQSARIGLSSINIYLLSYSLTCPSTYVHIYPLIIYSLIYLLTLAAYTYLLTHLSARLLCTYLSSYHLIIYLLTYVLAYSLTHSLTLSLTTYLLTVVLAYSRISEQRQELDSEALERGIDSVSSSDEEADFLPHCRQGYEGSSGSESDLPEIPGGEAAYGNACDFD